MVNKSNIIAKLIDANNIFSDDGIKIIGVFGSYAKANYDKYSDIDIAYRLDKEIFSKKYKDGFSKILKIMELKDYLEKSFSKKVDLISMNSSNVEFIDKIKKEMIYVESNWKIK